MSGRRNEPARARRRTRLKQALSLTSVPKSEEDAVGVATAPTLTIDNHFGWEVLQKSQIGDGTFPHLFRYYEKPDIHGREFDKVTYVLYMDKGTIVDKNTNREGIQNTVSGILISPKPSTYGDYHGYSTSRGDYYDETRVERVPWGTEVERERTKVVIRPEENIVNIPDRRKKKKLISEFYFVKRDRSRSRSPGDKDKSGHFDAGDEWRTLTTDGSKTHFSQIDHAVSEVEENVINEKHRAALIHKEINKEKEDALKSAKRAQENINQLRAGAEHFETEFKQSKEKYNKNPPVVKKISSRVVEYVQKCKSNKNEFAEELLKTSSGTNQYLYVSGKKKLR